jgi:hypothetical protein
LTAFDVGGNQAPAKRIVEFALPARSTLTHREWHALRAERAAWLDAMLEAKREPAPPQDAGAVWSLLAGEAMAAFALILVALTLRRSRRRRSATRNLGRMI